MLLTTPERSKLMASVRQTGTAPELIVREILRSVGVKFTTNCKLLPGCPDIYVPQHKVVIFVHGCFWHRHGKCKASTSPVRNNQFWEAKFKSNVKRDRRNLRLLKKLDLRSIILWECQIKSKTKLAQLHHRLISVLRRHRVGLLRSKTPRNQSHMTMTPEFDPNAQPESYSLSVDRSAIQRIVRRRDGSLCSTYFELGKSPPKRCSQEVLSALADRIYLRSSKWPPLVGGEVTFRVADLFSGCGLMTLGAWEACRAVGCGMRPVYAIDLNPYATNIYKSNFPTAVVEQRKVEEVLDCKLGSPLSPAETSLRAKLGTIDLLVGGPPCQGHSDLNNHTRRHDPKNRLYEKMGRFAEVVRPSHIIIENVPAAIRDRELVVETTSVHLKKIGYKVDSCVVEISCLGVAQARRRHVLVASLIHEVDIGKCMALYERRLRPVSWAISDLIDVKSKSALDRVSKPQAVNKERIDFLFDHNLYDLPDRERPDCHRLKRHSYKSVYGRMWWDKPAQTITTGFTCCGQGRFVHPKSRRTLTPHEAARIQFIPDFYRIDETIPRSAVVEVIGNAVPMKLTYVLALDLLR